jgi:sterol 3beta-glucosyltransferase
MVSKAGAGVKVSSLNTKELSEAFSKAVTHRVMREKAQIVGAKIRQENGVRTAKAFIYSRIGGARDAARVKRVKTLLEV